MSGFARGILAAMDQSQLNRQRQMDELAKMVQFDSIRWQRERAKKEDEMSQKRFDFEQKKFASEEERAKADQDYKAWTRDIEKSKYSARTPEEIMGVYTGMDKSTATRIAAMDPVLRATAIDIWEKQNPPTSAWELEKRDMERQKFQAEIADARARTAGTGGYAKTTSVPDSGYTPDALKRLGITDPEEASLIAALPPKVQEDFLNRKGITGKAENTKIPYGSPDSIMNSALKEAEDAFAKGDIDQTEYQKRVESAKKLSQMVDPKLLQAKSQEQYLLGLPIEQFKREIAKLTPETQRDLTTKRMKLLQEEMIGANVGRPTAGSVVGETLGGMAGDYSNSVLSPVGWAKSAYNTITKPIY